MSSLPQTFRSWTQAVDLKPQPGLFCDFLDIDRLENVPIVGIDPNFVTCSAHILFASNKQVAFKIFEHDINRKPVNFNDGKVAANLTSFTILLARNSKIFIEICARLCFCTAIARLSS
jgi:hypothetical protein